MRDEGDGEWRLKIFSGAIQSFIIFEAVIRDLFENKIIFRRLLIKLKNLMISVRCAEVYGDVEINPIKLSMPVNLLR